MNEIDQLLNEVRAFNQSTPENAARLFQIANEAHREVLSKPESELRARLLTFLVTSQNTIMEVRNTIRDHGPAAAAGEFSGEVFNLEDLLAQAQKL